MGARRRYPSRPLVGAGAVVRKDGEVLLVRRRFPPNMGKWALPGGLIELGETTEAAAAREIEEETGFKVKIVGLLDVQTEVHRDPNERLEYHYVLVDYLATPIGGKMRLNQESSGYGWFTETRSKSLKMSDGTRAVLRKAFRHSLH